MDKFLSGKEVLFVCPEFFNYHSYIIEELKLSGALVHFVPEARERFLFKILRRTSLKKLEHVYEKYYSGLIDWKRKYDIVFIIKGIGLSEYHLKELRHRNPGALFVHYQWDSVRNFDHLYMKEFFDRLYSFDRDDCRNYGFTYKPLFFVPSFNSTERAGHHRDYTLDLVFIGTANNERIRFFSELKPFLLENELSFCIILYCTPLKYLKFVLGFHDRTFLTTRKSSEKEVVEIMERSKAVIDMPSENQTGLTMRTFEALGSGKMLITTNKRISEEPFFNSDQISIIEGKDFSFMKTLLSRRDFDFPPVSEYSLRNWTRSILK